MIPVLFRPLLSFWLGSLLVLLLLRWLGTLPPCLCFAYSAPPANYGFTELRLWDASTGISLKLAENPFIGDVISPQNREFIAYSQETSLRLLQTNRQSRQINFPNGIAAPHFSPNGMYLAYSIAPNVGVGLYLRIVELDGSSITLHNDAINPMQAFVWWQPQ